MDISKYEIDLKKVMSLENKDKKIIMQLIDDMMRYCHESTFDIATDNTKEMANFLFKSLYNEGYVVSSRDKKISGIVSDDN
jgi:hypothetical protein